jgi:hypothetical protein
MKLPGADQAIVDGAKVRDYLLSLEHPIGRFKAAFFGSLGYTRNQWQRLRQDLLQLGQSGTVEQGQESAFGQKYEVRGILEGPSGGRADIVTVWIVLNGEESPRFVTAFPGEAR